ncbi:MAG: HEAT repeat domain-containing protein [Planctomycetaceae bacterium]
MRRLTRYAIWVAAPLALASGCAGPSWMMGSNSARDVDPSQRMMQIARQYEASGNSSAAERLYRQLSHMQPNNVEARERLSALVQQNQRDAQQPSSVSQEADASELLAMLRQKRDKFEAQQHGVAEPTLADVSPSIVEAPLTNIGAPPAPTFEDVAGPWEHAIAKNEPVTRPFPAETRSMEVVPESVEPAPAPPRPYEPVVEKEAELPLIVESGRSYEDVLAEAEKLQDSPFAASTGESMPQPNLAWTRAKTNAKPVAEVAAEPVENAQAGEVESVAMATEEDAWWSNVFEDHGSVRSASEDLALAEEESGFEFEDDATSASDSGDLASASSMSIVEDAANWTHTSHERLCPNLLPELKPLVADLSSDDSQVRIAALNQLATYGDQAATAELAVRVLLTDSNPLVRAHAASALRDIKNDAWDSVRTLRQLVFHHDDEVAQTACYMLGRIGTEAMEAVPELSTLRDAGRGVTSLHAAEALVRIAPHDTESVDVLLGAAKDGTDQERLFASVALTSTTTTHRADVVAALVKALEDESAEVRAAAALSLGGLGRDAVSAREALQQVALNDSQAVQEAAHTALACLEL